MLLMTLKFELKPNQLRVLSPKSAKVVCLITGGMGTSFISSVQVASLVALRIVENLVYQLVWERCIMKRSQLFLLPWMEQPLWWSELNKPQHEDNNGNQSTRYENFYQVVGLTLVVTALDNGLGRRVHMYKQPFEVDGFAAGAWRLIGLAKESTRLIDYCHAPKE